MNFKEEFHPKIKSDLKKIDKFVVKRIKEFHLNKILENPYNNPSLKGNLSNVYSYHFRENRTEYRIAYTIKDNVIIFYYMIASRENFYKMVGNRI